MNRPAWSSRSLGSKLQHEFFYATIRVGGWRLAYCVLALVVAVYTLRPRVRARQQAYLSRRFPRAGTVAMLVHSLRQNWEFGKILVDRALKGITGQGFVDVKASDQELFTSLLQRGQGLLVLTAHVGAWQWAMADLDTLKHRLHVLYVRDVADVDKQYFEHGQAAHAPTFIDPRTTFGAVIEVMAALRQGDIVCAMGDRVFGGEQGRTCACFLGHPFQIPLGPFHIASKIGTPMVVLFAPRTGVGRAAIRIAHTWENPLGIPSQKMAHTFAACLDSFVQDNPYQYFNYYDLWAGPQ